MADFAQNHPYSRWLFFNLSGVTVSPIKIQTPLRESITIPTFSVKWNFVSSVALRNNVQALTELLELIYSNNKTIVVLFVTGKCKETFFSQLYP